MLSKRMQEWLEVEDSILHRGFVAAKNNPYHAEKNPTGIINIG